MVCELQFLTAFVSAVQMLIDVHPLRIVLMNLWIIRLYGQDTVLQNLAESKSKPALWLRKNPGKIPFFAHLPWRLCCI